MSALKYLFTASLAMLITLGAFAQEQFPVINKDILFQKIDEDTTGARFFMVVTFVNYCHGVADINPDIKMLDSVTDHQTRYFLCQASRGKDDRGEYLEKVMKDYGIDEHNVYLIDDQKYKTEKKDPRKQGATFRNDLCSSCSLYSVISGTFYIIFDKEKNILFSGFMLHNKQLSAILTCNK